MRRALIAVLLLAAACGTPQEQCIARNTRDLRVVERLLAETEANLRRGYALEEVTVYRSEWVDCTPRVIVVEGQPEPEPPERKLCLEDVPQTITRPKAIDLNAEAAKRDSLVTKRNELLRAAEGVIAACRAAYPEEG
jgi:hypothetical protein